MIKNFNTVLVNPILKEEFKDPEGKSITVGLVCSSALLDTYEDERALSGDDKRKRLQLALRVLDEKEQDFIPDELTLIKNLVGKKNIPVIVGPVYDFLDA